MTSHDSLKRAYKSIRYERIYKPKPAIMPICAFLIDCDCGSTVRLYLNARRATCKKCGKKYQYTEGQIISGNEIIFE